MTGGKNKRISKEKKGGSGKEKAAVSSFTGGELIDCKLPSNFPMEQVMLEIRKRLGSRTHQGIKVHGDYSQDVVGTKVEPPAKEETTVVEGGTPEEIVGA